MQSLFQQYFVFATHHFGNFIEELFGIPSELSPTNLSSKNSRPSKSGGRASGGTLNSVHTGIGTDYLNP